jgi:hypothetical protein
MILLPCLNCFWNLWALHSANLEILWLAVAHLTSNFCNFTVTEIHLHALGLKLMFFSHSATSCLSSPLYAFGLDAYLYRDNWQFLPSSACLFHLWHQFVPDQCLLSSFDKANSEVTPSPKVPEEPASSSSYETLANLCAAATMSCHVNHFQKTTRILPSHSMNLVNQEMIVHGSRPREFNVMFVRARICGCMVAA